jgi:beta-lactamase regulating signal transducer with metallopeptidase domain
MNPTTTEAVAWALLHFVWQGAAIAIVSGVAGAAMSRRRPQARHALFCCALALMALAPLVTLLSGAPQVFQPAAHAIASSVPSPPVPGLQAARPAAGFDWLSWLVRVWLCGVAVLGARSFGGWVLAQRMTRWKTIPAAASFQSAALRLRARLDIRRPVRILASAVAEVPAAIGWLRPVVLLPASLLTALTPTQIELLIAHELAHVRRYDYLVNLLQTVVETVLFYHPAVWWVSGRIRAEREHCCDDLAVAACGDAAIYARTLAALEGMRAGRGALVVAADDGSLLARIKRLADRDRVSRRTPPAWFGALLPAALVAGVFSVAPPEAVAESEGFLRGLADAGYTKLSVDEIITLKEHGVEPRYIKLMLSAGLGPLDVDQLVRLRTHGLSPEFVAGVARSGLVSDLDVPRVIALQENGADADEMSRIRALGFGPYAAEEVVRLRQNGVDAATFQALKEMGLDRAGVPEAVELRQNGITPERIRSMKRQGFNNLTLEQVVKLSRGGII